MEPRKTSRSEKCRKHCFRSFQNRCMYIGKAAKVAIIQICSLLVSTWWQLNFRCRQYQTVNVADSIRLSMFKYWRKSSANLCGSHSNLDKNLLVSRFWKLFLKTWLPVTRKIQTKIMRARPGPWYGDTLVQLCLWLPIPTPEGRQGAAIPIPRLKLNSFFSWTRSDFNWNAFFSRGQRYFFKACSSESYP